MAAEMVEICPPKSFIGIKNSDKTIPSNNMSNSFFFFPISWVFLHHRKDCIFKREFICIIKYDPFYFASTKLIKQPEAYSSPSESIIFSRDSTHFEIIHHVFFFHNFLNSNSFIKFKT